MKTLNQSEMNFVSGGVARAIVGLLPIVIEEPIYIIPPSLPDWGIILHPDAPFTPVLLGGG